MDKPLLFVLWGSPYTFCDTLAPQLPALASRFRIVLAMTDHCVPECAIAAAQELRAGGALLDFFILPVWEKSMLARHRVMAQLVPLLAPLRFDAFLSVSTALAYERYITDLLCPRALRILYWPHLCNQHLDPALSDALQIEGPLPKAAMRRCEREQRPVFRLFDRYLWPLSQVGRVFPAGKWDAFSQVGTEFDLMLLHDAQDAADFRRIYGREEIQPVAFPRVPLPARRINAILMPFSLHGEIEANKSLPLYVRDLKSILMETGALEIHLRPHPGKPNQFLPAFTEALRRSGVPIFISPSADPLTSQAAQYRGVVGAASASLRDVRLACKDVFVVGLESLSQDYTLRAKRLVGAGVDWIESDGSYRREIFQPSSYITSLPEASDVIIDAYERRAAA